MAAAAEAPVPVAVSAAFAAFTASAASRALPRDALHATRRAFANWLACALGAAGDGDAAAALRVATAVGGPAQASVVGHAARLDAVNAALVNGIAANALDYDDMHVPTLIHPTGAVAAAAYALAEARRAGGGTLLAALACGIEVECRLGMALFPQHYDKGWHITATLGTLGAAAAAAVVAGLDTGRTAHALGLAATQAAGLRAMLPNPCKSFNIGRAASAGVLSVLLAEAGFDSEPRALEARHGLFDVFGWPADPAALVRDLGGRHLVREVSLKPYPCGVVIHPAIDACLELSRQRGVDAGAIAGATLSVHPRVLELAGRRHPESAISARFSVFHAAALAFARRAAGFAAFAAASVDDPELVALRERIEVVAEPALRPSQARARVTLRDGGSLEARVDQPSGSPHKPLTDAQLREKFLELAARRMDARCAAQLHDECMALERAPDVSTLRRCWAR
jgi:2-methylcitrate dehydratase PrpD